MRFPPIPFSGMILLVQAVRWAHGFASVRTLAFTVPCRSESRRYSKLTVSLSTDKLDAADDAEDTAEEESNGRFWVQNQDDNFEAGYPLNDREGKVAKLRDQISQMQKVLDETSQIFTESKQGLQQLNKDIETVTPSIAEPKKIAKDGATFDDELIDKLEDLPLMKRVVSPEKPLETKQEMLRLDTEKLRLIEKQKECKPLENKSTGTIAPVPRSRKSGLLFVAENHHLEFLGENSTRFRIGIIEEITSKDSSQRTFKVRDDIDTLKPCNELEKAWSLVNDKQMSNDELINKLVQQLPELDEKLLRIAWQDLFQLLFPIDSIAEMGEMRLQQVVYPPLSVLFMAAAGEDKEYKADEVITSSLSILYKELQDETVPTERKVRVKPDSSVILNEGGWDPCGMLELKPCQPPDDLPSLIDYDKCSLMTTITALAIRQCMMVKEDQNYDWVAIPFVVAVGGHCSLYATTLDKQGIPSIRVVEYPSGRNGRSNSFDSSSSLERKEIFIALAVLLNRFKSSFQDYKQIYNGQLDAPTEELSAFPTTALSRSNATISQNTHKGRGNHESNGMACSQEEQIAQEAAACGGRFVNVAYPHDRFLYFTDDSIEVDQDQMKSPFFFRGTSRSLTVGMQPNNLFLKVWKAADVDSRLVELESLYHMHAFKAGVPVAAPVLPEIARSTSLDGTEYLVLAVEYICKDRIKTVDDTVKFCRSLIQTVEMLHSRAQLLHCDLKPENLRWSDGAVRLVDFGRAQLILKAKCVRGTDGFEAPEVLNGMACSTKTDAFSIGRIILQCLNNVDEEEWQQQVETYNILYNTAAMLTKPQPESRWCLAQAYEKILTIKVDMD